MLYSLVVYSSAFQVIKFSPVFNLLQSRLIASNMFASSKIYISSTGVFKVESTIDGLVFLFWCVGQARKWALGRTTAMVKLCCATAHISNDLPASLLPARVA